MNRRTLMTMALLGMAILAASSQVALAQTNLGTWKLNLAKSNYSPGPAPRSGTFTFQADGQNLRNISEGIDAEGKPTRAVFIHIYDGKPYPTTGAVGYDSSAYTRVDANVVKFSRINSGKSVQSGLHVVSSDGKALTVITIGTGPNGREINNVAVYDKQ